VKLEKNRFAGIWNVQGNTVIPSALCVMVVGPCQGLLGNLQVNENTVLSGELNISGNSVREDLQLLKNRGTTRVTTNRIGENLQCFDNTPPPISIGNIARNYEGQCLL
jgi:hypothetical protein